MFFRWQVVVTELEMMFELFYPFVCMVTLLAIHLLFFLSREISTVQSPNGTILFNIVPPNGPRFDLEIAGKDVSVRKLFEEVSAFTGIPESTFLLFKNGQKVGFHTSLFEYYVPVQIKKVLRDTSCKPVFT